MCGHVQGMGVSGLAWLATSTSKTELSETQWFHVQKLLSGGFDMLPHFGAGDGWADPISAAVGLTAFQIGLVDLLEKDYGIRPSGIIAHSHGTFMAASSLSTGGTQPFMAQWKSRSDLERMAMEPI